MPDRPEGPAPLSDTVVDTSAAVALLTGATIGGEVAHTMATADRVLISTATVVELGIVLESRLGPVGAAVLDRFLRAGQVEVIAVTGDTAHSAIDAWRRYGKGRHRAGLNYGDCFVYALAASEGAAVLCVGEDFPHTDVTIAPLT